MNRLIQNLFSILFPFYPLLAWGFHFVTFKPLGFFLNILLLPLALSFLGRKKLPGYLVFYALFVVYHIASSVLNDTIPPGTNKLFYILFDYNVFALSMLIIIENTWFEEKFIDRMNKNIFLIVVLSLLVSVAQIKDPTFFYNGNAVSEEMANVGADGGEARNQSIYSWYSINSVGITFPILISLILSFYETRKSRFFIVVLSAIIVSFLTKARYVMLSTLIVFSQLFFARLKSASKIISLIGAFTAGVFLIIFIADQAGYNIQEVISSRILEEDSDMESAKARVKSYEVFLIKFPENPWLGVGPATKSDVVELLGGGIPYIHVGYLSYLYYYGIAGCFLLFVSLFFLVRDAWRTGKTYKFWGSFYGLITFCFANATFVYFNFAEMGIILAVIYLRYYNTTYADMISEEETPIKAI